MYLKKRLGPVGNRLYNGLDLNSFVSHLGTIEPCLIFPYEYLFPECAKILHIKSDA